jgi:hypothetical protein
LDPHSEEGKLQQFTVKDLGGFQEMIAPTLIKVLYWIGLVVIAVGALVQLFSALGHMGTSFLGGLGLALGVVVGAIFSVLFWRVMCELWIVLFRIYERLGELKESKG